MFNKQLFIFAHQIGDMRFYSLYKKLLDSQWKPYEHLKNDQEKQLRHIINFSYKNVPFYRKLFDSLNLSPDDITKIEHLEKLPIIDKNTILKNWNDFKPVNLRNMKFYTKSTGGSTTGTPLHFRISKYDRFLLGALLYRGWGYGGYKLGDKMIYLGGSSLGINSKHSFVDKVYEIPRNIKKLSSYDMSSQKIEAYVKLSNKFNPLFFRGYASSLYFLAKYIEDNNLQIKYPVSVFSAAEKLYPYMSQKINHVFNCDVYDNYGLNDGGVTAYECSEHNGLHIDTERSIMEIVDNGSQVENGNGNIVATSLYNYAMPFIRYDTGDLGHIIEDKCSCGRGHKLLKEVIGREYDIFQTPDNKYIHGGFFTQLSWEINGISEYQVIQKKIDKIVILLSVDATFNENEINKIRRIIWNHCDKWDVEFKFVDKIERTKSGKYKFIINEVGK